MLWLKSLNCMPHYNDAYEILREAQRGKGSVCRSTVLDDHRLEAGYPNSPIFLASQFMGDPEPMDNFVVPTGVWSDGTPDHM